MATLCGATVTKLALVQSPEGGWSGYCSHFQALTLKHDCLISLSGEIGQQRYHPDPYSLRSWNDIYKCYKLLDFNLELLDQYKNEAQVLIYENWNDVVRVAEALLEAGSLSGEQINALLWQKV